MKDLLILEMKKLIKKESSMINDYSLEDFERFLILNFRKKLENFNQSENDSILREMKFFYLLEI